MNKKTFIAILFILIISVPLFAFGVTEKISSLIEPINETVLAPAINENTATEVASSPVSTEMFSSISNPCYSIELIEQRLITKEEVSQMKASLSEAYGVDVSEDDALNYIVDQELLGQAIQRSINNGEISLEGEDFSNFYSQQLASFAAQNGIQLTSDEDVQSFIQTIGEENYNSFVNYIVQAYSENTFVFNNSNGRLDSVVEPTELEIKETYNAYKSSFVSEDAVYAAHIEILFGEDKDLAKTKATSALYNIRKGLPWIDAVKTYSEDPNTVSRNGEFGVWIYPSTTGFADVYGKEAFDLLFTMEKDEVSEVIESSNAYHIYYLVDYKKGGLLQLNDLYDLNSTATVSDYIKYVLTQEKQNQLYTEVLNDIIDSLREEATLKSLV